ncbi:MAG TPA: MaoC/PaaZ C-terminal domain-containing protein [Solirubrobacterales bacterium]|jgi:acyl dehydratase|nr:MaoC/PaaZ C-terminal domain-containing protein [Solirubrobacterales bacterium]
MTARTLESSPSILPLYARAAAPMIPGASLLPFVPGGGGEIPELELELAGVRAKPEDVAAYARVCGFALRDHLPPTYPHVLAFPLQMAVMADGSFPFGAVGLVHVENRIEQHRRIGSGEELAINVRPTKLQPHSKGRTFSLLTKVTVDGELLWESISTMLRRGNDSASTPKDGNPEPHQVSGPAGRKSDAVREGELGASAEWKLGGDLGRRYAGVSGDRNPIHMHSLTAKPLGFPGAIAHGMWTKARCLAALESRLPDAFAVDVRFRKPILLPGRVEFASAAEGEEIAFVVRDAKRQTPHLDGRVRPLEPKPNANTGRKSK